MSSKNSPRNNLHADPAAEFQAVLGKIPSGLFILTIAHRGQATGMLVSWVMQAGFTPPMVTVALKRGRYVADWLVAEKRFALNVIGEAGKPLLKHFARGFEPEQEAFAGRELASGSAVSAPILREAAGYLDCELVGQLDSEDHHIFLAKIVDGRLHCQESPWVHIRPSGDRY